MTRTIASTVVTTHTYEYDDANRLTKVDGVTYTWDANGNLLSDGTRTFTYDVANRLVQVVSGTITTTFAYNGDGHRMHKVAGGVTTTYVLAVLGLPQVVVETTGGSSTAYLYGHDLLGEEGTAWAWHLNDGLGSVRQLTDGDGDVTLAQGYTPFGVLLWREGDAVSGYGYTGEQEDPSAGLVFLRARYYDPTTGRFTSKDPFPGLATVPATLHPYLYSLNNPVNYTDPSGEYIESLWDFAMILLDIGFLASDIYYYTEVNPCADPWEIIGVIGLDAVSLVLDVVCLALPILPGGWGTGLRLAGGETAALTRAAAHVPQIARTAQAVLKGVQTAEQIVHFAVAKGGGRGSPGRRGGSSRDGDRNVQPRVSRPDGGYEKGMMTDQEFEGIQKVADKWKRPIDVCGGFAETETGLAKRAANDPSVPDWRQGPLPTWAGDLDVSQIMFEGLSPGQKTQLEADLLDVFKDAGVTHVDTGYNTPRYPAGPLNPQGQPNGSIRFYPDGTTRRILAPWQ